MRRARSALFVLGLLSALGCGLLEPTPPLSMRPGSGPPDPDQWAISRFLFGTRYLPGQGAADWLWRSQGDEGEAEPSP